MVKELLSKFRKCDVYYIINKLTKNIKKEWKIAFVSTIIIGLIAHLFVMVNIIPNHDGIFNIYANQNCINLGRCFIQYACGLTSYYTLPWIIGIFSLVTIAITSIMIIELFNIRRKLNIILISGFLVTYPTVASTFAYVYTMDGYMLSLMFATLSVVLAYKYKYGFIIGSIFICISLGIYQAYVSVAILLCILKIMISIIDKHPKKEILIEIAKDLIMLLIGFISYYIILKIMLNIEKVTLSTYQGVNSLNNISLINIYYGIKHAIKDFIQYPIRMNFYKSNVIILISNLLIAIFLIYMYIKEFIEKKYIKNGFTYLYW